MQRLMQQLSTLISRRIKMKRLETINGQEALRLRYGSAGYSRHDLITSIR